MYKNNATDRMEVIGKVVSALEKEFGDGWGVAVSQIRIGNGLDFRVYMEQNPHGLGLTPMEEAYFEHCNKYDLDRNWLYAKVTLGGIRYELIGWDLDSKSKHKVMFKSILPRGMAGGSYVRLTPHQVQTLGLNGLLELVSDEEE